MDKTKISRLLSDFALISGMEISLLDSNFHTISMVRSPECNLCSLIHRVRKNQTACNASDVDRLCRAEMSGKEQLYTCPFGMTEAIVPIIRGESAAFYLIATMGILDTELDSTAATVRASIDPSELSELDTAISRMRILTEEQRDAYLSMIKMLAEHIAADATISDGEESIGKLVKYYVKNNLSKKLTLTDIALNLHCSTVTLTEHFRREFGMTIMEYITKKRMDLAEQLLLGTTEPLGEIAALVGFSDVEYFSRTFKKFHGVAPGAWRKTAERATLAN